MAFSVSEFKANGSRGGVRPNKFLVDIFLPVVMQSPNANKIRWMVEGASIPEGIMGVVRLPYMGRTIPYSGDPEYPDWNITVQNDFQFNTHNIMRKWQTMMNTPDSNVMDESFYPDEGKGTGIVTQYAQDGKKLQVYEIVDLFPTNISPITLNWAQNNTYETFDVTFAMTMWRLGVGTQGGPDVYSDIAPNDQRGV
jgi:hypothetical protein